MAAFDRARRFVLGTALEHLEQVPRRIRGGITSEKRGLRGIRSIFGTIIRDFGNLMAKFDRARRVVFGTSLEHL